MKYNLEKLKQKRENLLHTPVKDIKHYLEIECDINTIEYIMFKYFGYVVER